MCIPRAGIAQLVEQRIRNAWVGGSIPLSGTNRFLYTPNDAPPDASERSHCACLSLSVGLVLW